MPDWPNISARYGRIPMLRLKRKRSEGAEGAQAVRAVKPKRASANLGTICRIGVYLAADKLRLGIVSMLILISVLAGITGPYLLGHTVQDYLVDRRTEGLIGALARLGGVYALQTVSVLLQNFLMIGVAQRTVADIRRDLFAKLHRTSLSAYAGKKTGDLMSRVTNDIDNVSTTLSNTVVQMTSSILTFAGMLGLMLWLNVWMTLISLSLIPLMFLSIKWITRRTGALFREQQRALGGLTGFVDETISGQLVVKSFAQEKNRVRSFGKLNLQTAATSYWAQTYSGFIPKVLYMLNNLSFAIIAAAGSLLAVAGVVTIGIIVTFAEYIRQYSRPLNELANQINATFSAVAGAERAFELMDAAEETDAADAWRPGRLRGEIAFEHVGFAYEEGKKIIHDLSLRIAPGQTLALVGATGAGKTTVAQLIGRFYETTEGRILIDGVPIGQCDRFALRRQMAFVLQDSFLFEMSVRENIRYGKADASDAEVEKAAKQANAHDFIEKLPEGYDTIIGADGSISQGQRQLLSIARAILADPVILVLDEATSSVDTVTEANVRQALDVLMKGRTNLIIAHRLSTVRDADLILVLEGGRAVEQGTHESLLARKGYYYRLCESSDTYRAEH